MALEELYEVTMSQEYLGQSLVNVFTYFQVSETGSSNWAQLLAQQFRARWMTVAGATAFDSVAFSDNLNWISVTVRNLFNGAEVGVILDGAGVQGSNTGVNDNPFVCYRFTQARGRGDMRNGQKFFGGLCAGAAVNGEINATNFAALDSVVTALNDPLEYDAGGLVAQWNHVIVKRVLEPASETHKAYYRLPENSGEYTAYIADNWTKEPLLTTSNRRKIGRGS